MTIEFKGEACYYPEVLRLRAANDRFYAFVPLPTREGALAKELNYLLEPVDRIPPYYSFSREWQDFFAGWTRFSPPQKVQLFDGNFLEIT